MTCYLCSKPGATVRQFGNHGAWLHEKCLDDFLFWHRENGSVMIATEDRLNREYHEIRWSGDPYGDG